MIGDYKSGNEKQPRAGYARRFYFVLALSICSGIPPHQTEARHLADPGPLPLLKSDAKSAKTNTDN
jgi:hypothetical protein